MVLRVVRALEGDRRYLSVSSVRSSAVGAGRGRGLAVAVCVYVRVIPSATASQEPLSATTTASAVVLEVVVESTKEESNTGPVDRLVVGGRQCAARTPTGGVRNSW